jgi:hypothetical protein
VTALLYPPDITRAGLYAPPDTRLCGRCGQRRPLAEWRHVRSAAHWRGWVHRPCEAREARAESRRVRAGQTPAQQAARVAYRQLRVTQRKRRRRGASRPWHRLQTQWWSFLHWGEVGYELLAVYDAAARECVAAGLAGWVYPALCGALGEELRRTAA